MPAYVANYHASVTLEVHGDPMLWIIHFSYCAECSYALVSAKGDFQQCANVTRY